jgi:hypothetical protein
MMIKVFTTNKNGKIEISPEELKKLLDESYWEGYSAKSTWTYTSPYTNSPYIYTTTTSGVTISNTNTTTDNVTIDASKITL